MAPIVAIRADAGVTMGTGHVMRCLALAQAWRENGGQAVLVTAQITQPLFERLRSEHIEVVELGTSAGGEEDARAFLETARAHGADWLVVDGYQFDSAYQSAIRAGGCKLLFIDDNAHARHYSADLVLNQNVHAREQMYSSREPSATLLLGPRYALLRREFKSWHNWKREIPAVGGKVLVTLGGSDPDNVTTAVVHGLCLVKMKGLEVMVVLGGSNPHLASVERAAAHFPGNIRLQGNSPDMAALMTWADVAIAGAGSTCYEMCFLGLPAMVVELAENQRPLAQELDRLGAVAFLGNGAEVSPQEIAGKLEWLLSAKENRAEMSRRGRELVDGRGAGRVVDAMMGPVLRLRRAEENDCRLLWEWVNDPEVRSASFSSSPIFWEEHRAWFAARVNSPQYLVLIGHNGNGKPVGQFRVEWRSDREGEISISVAANARGKGVGSRLIELGVQQVFATTDAGRLHAFIRPQNLASIRMFERTGFRKLQEEMVKGERALHYVRTRNGDGSR